MKRATHAFALALLLAAPLHASGHESRVRLESTSAREPVDIVLSEVDPSRRPGRVTTAAVDGGEVVVEAAAPRPRLRGGTLRTDPMIDLLATELLRGSSSSQPAVMVLPDSSPVEPRYSQNPLVWGVGDWDSCGYCYAPQFAYGYAGWGAGVTSRQPRHDHPSRTAPAPRPTPRGSFSARAMMPRR